HSNRSQWPAMAPHGVYPCEGDDNWVAISCRADTEWDALADLVGEPWAFRDDWRTLAGRLAAEDDLDADLAAWTAGQERFDLAARLQSVGVPAAAVTKPSERIDDDANAAAWRLWASVDHAAMGEGRVDGLPGHLAETDWDISAAAPLLGQHNDLVLSDVLGLSASDIEGLREEGAI